MYDKYSIKVQNKSFKNDLVSRFLINPPSLTNSIQGLSQRLGKSGETIKNTTINNSNNTCITQSTTCRDYNYKTIKWI